MSRIDKPRILIITVAVLVALNLATLTFLWLNNRPHPRGRQGEAPAQYLIEQVGLTPDQITAYRALIQEHQSNMRSINDSIRYHKLQLFSYLQSADSSNARRESGRIGDLQKAVEMNTFDHFLKVRALCDPFQEVKFDNVIGEVLRMMAPPGPPGKK
jgi:protein CpxP